MILLEPANRIINETLTQRLTNAIVENTEEGVPSIPSIDTTMADFDGALLKLTVNKTMITLSAQIKGYNKLQEAGVSDILTRVYGSAVQSSAESGFDVTLSYPLDSVPRDTTELEQWIQKLSLLKRHILSAPLERAFDQQQSNASNSAYSGPLMTIPYRDDETLFIQAHFDRVTVIYATLFKDATDVVLSKTFLQEFGDARRLPAMQNTPQVLYSVRTPPLELKSVVTEDKDNVGYVTFVLNPRHYQGEQRRQQTISAIETFRNYLHYHIKCSKGYLHSRMRARVADFLKVLNRAKPDVINAEKKLASGKTFKRT